MNKRKFIAIVLTVLMCFPFIINASVSAEITGDTVYLRSGPGTNYSKLATMYKGYSITLPDKTLYEGKDCSQGWYKATYGSKTGYVCSKYVTFQTTATAINTESFTARISSNNIKCRSGASTSKSVQDTLSLGVNVRILETINTNNSGCTGEKWYKVLYYNNKVGYVCANYVYKREAVTLSDAEYAQELKAKGFPDSYIPYLTHLHNKYPNWVFQAKKTNLDFNYAVTKEQGVNYMQTTNNAYRTSTTPAEGSSWFKVNRGVIAFYMDPRNWLTEGRIFQFEKLDYDDAFESQYPRLVKTVFGSGKLSADKYTIPIYTMGKKYGVSPLHLASRIRLEVGVNGSGSTSGGEFTYKGVTYSGYYNFYNIGAYEQTIDGVKYSAVTMGLVTAMNNGWDTIEKAIEYGARFIANGYVTEGQGTIYYQKFNVNPNTTSTKFSHQYMTNIQAPVTEGNQTYSSYKSGGILSESFIFEIPVYNNMPDYTSLPDSYNLGEDSDYLSSLEVEGYTINFSKNIQRYIVHVSEDTTSVNISATPMVEEGVVAGTGEFAIPGQNATATITVTTNTTRKYTIFFVKPEPEPTPDPDPVTPDPDPTPDPNEPEVPADDRQIIVNAGYKLKDSYVYNFGLGNTVQTVLEKINNQNATITDKSDNNKTSGKIATGDKIKINNSTFTVIIYGDVNGDGEITILDLSLIQMHLLKKQSLKNAYLVAADASKNNTVDILDLSLVQMHLLKKQTISQS